MNLLGSDNKFLEKEIYEFLKWNTKNPIGKIPKEVSKEGAGESRIPLTHLANSVPVYLYFSLILKNSKLLRSTVLDLGCGTGRNISYIKNQAYKDWDFYGIDYSNACIDYAYKRYGDFDVNFLRYHGKRIPFPDNTFNYIVSSHVIEHISKHHASFFLQEIIRVLKEGGVAIVGTPNRKYCQDLFHKNPDDIRKYRLVIPHKHEFYKKELEQLLSKFSKEIESNKIFQTKNSINHALMRNAINKIKPTNSFGGKLKFEIYNTLRSSPPVQDLMAKLGIEVIMRGTNTTYSDILKSTKIFESEIDIGDNFIIQINR